MSVKQMLGLIQGSNQKKKKKKSNITTIWLLCSLKLNISLPSHCLAWLIPLSLCPSLPLMMPSQCYSAEENISVPDWQWHLCVTPPPVIACVTAESSLEDKSTWLSDIDSTSNDILRWPWSPPGDREVQFKPLAESFSLPYNQRGDGNDNDVVERWVPNDRGDICRENHLSRNEASAKEFTWMKPHHESENATLVTDSTELYITKSP